jgi:hypothetical protein
MKQAGSSYFATTTPESVTASIVSSSSSSSSSSSNVSPTPIQKELTMDEKWEKEVNDASELVDELTEAIDALNAEIKVIYN